jgi:flagellar motor switch protein FliM
MKKLFFWLFFWVLPGSFVFGQNIDKLEYFLDTDPGIGNGINLPFSPGLQKELNNFSFNIPQTGFNNSTFLYIRARFDNGNWGIVFQKKIAPTVVVLPAIIKAEYFINTDPGFGNGVNIPITAGQVDLSNVSFTIPNASLTSGTDFLYVRTKNEKGQWSEVLMKQLENVPVNTAPAIVKAEYFINTDPGFGNGVNIPITAGQVDLSNVSFTIPNASLTSGTDFLYVRTKNEKGQWSEVLMKQLENVPANAAPAIVKAEYFINTDPGFGSGVNIPITAGQIDLNNVSFTIPNGSLTSGTDFLFVRTKNEKGQWSEVLMKQLENVPVNAAPAIVKAEYFINTDPGFGSGVNIPITAGQVDLSNVSFTIPNASLTSGTDFLYVRTKNEKGQWSEVLMKQLENVPVNTAPAIVKAEYFINTDPGFGSGVNIPITAGQVDLSNVSFTIPNASLTSGTDFLFVRTKNEKGQWSEVLMKQLENVPVNAAPAIVKAEYFINTDPGFGSGVNIPITAGQVDLSNISFTIPNGSLTSGTDFLYVRTKNEKGQWSEVLMKQLENVPVNTAPAIVKAEYFINTDPGFGNGVNIPITAGQVDLSNVSFTIPNASLTSGTDFLYVRTKNEKGQWSEVLMKQLENAPVNAAPAIVKAEYFINSDPGFGNGVNIPITSGQVDLTNVNFTIPAASLTSGTDFLFVRTKNEKGQWSEVLMKQLDILPAFVTPSIVKAEYFIDTDPGFGNGVNIPITAGLTSLNNTTIDVTVSSLSEGFHNLYIRTKDEKSRWSEPLMREIYVDEKHLEIFPAPDPLCINAPITIHYISDFDFSSSETVDIFLSNSAGLFNTNILLGSTTVLSGSFGGSLQVNIPANLDQTSGYRILAQSTNRLGVGSKPLILKTCAVVPCNQLIVLNSPTDDITSGLVSKSTNLTITANNKITGSGKLNLKAGQSILIDGQNGVFLADQGTVFQAEIGGCVE